MSVTPVRHCDECGDVIQSDDPYITFKDVTNHRFCKPIITPCDFCSLDCLHKFIEKKMRK